MDTNKTIGERSKKLAGIRVNLFLTETGYQKSLKNQSCDEIKILRHAKVCKSKFI